MPIPLLLIGAGIMAAAGAAKAIHGAKQAKEGRRLAANNVRPDYTVQDEYYNNQDLAANMAQRGLTEQALDYYTTNAERGLSVSVDGLLQAGGNVNSISSAVDNYNRSLAQVAATDAEMKNANIRYLIDRNKDLAGQKTMQWSLNKYEPYKDTAATAAALQKTGTENLYSGISQVGSSIAAASSSYNYGGGVGAGSKTGIQTVLPNATVSAPSTMASSNVTSPALINAYNLAPIGAINDAQTDPEFENLMRDYDNSPYKDYIRARLLNGPNYNRVGYIG